MFCKGRAKSARAPENCVNVRHEVAQLADWQGLHGALTNPGIPLVV